MIALGTPRELIRLLGAEHVVEFAMVDGEPLPDPEALRPLPGIRDVRVQDTTCGLVASEIHLAIPALLDLPGDQAGRSWPS